MEGYHLNSGACDTLLQINTTFINKCFVFKKNWYVIWYKCEVYIPSQKPGKVRGIFFKTNIISERLGYHTAM